LILAAWGLLLGAWVVTNPPFAAPDETDHFVRAIGLSEGHLIGQADPSARIGVSPRQIAWTRQAARLVTVPAGLNPLPFTCATGSGNRSAVCLNSAQPDRSAVTLATAVGNYQPLPYLLPAAVLRSASSPPGALRLARAAGALTVLALLAVALLALYDVANPVLSVVGLLLAVTPMVLFCASSLNGSGLEIAAGIAFFSCLLRLARPGSSRRWWVATMLTGAVLVLSRSASPLWLVVGLAVVIAWRDTKTVVAGFVRRPAAWITAGVFVLAVVLNQAWEAAYGSHVEIDTGAVHAGLVAGAHEWWRALPELVGKFGYINVKLPLILPVVWFALVFGLILIAYFYDRRARPVLLILTLAAAVAPVVFYALVTRPTGFGLQGRQVLPVLVIPPLLAGEICYRCRNRLSAVARRLLLVIVPIAVAVVQAAAWFVNAKRFAVGTGGPSWFLASAKWSPPLGWTLWLVVVLAGASCLGFVSIMRSNRSSQTSPVA
jgi:hypothetical protein